MTLEVDKIVEAIITGQALDLDEAENVSRFVQASQSKFDLGVLAIGADHLSRYGRASRLMNLLEQMLLPDPDITLECKCLDKTFAIVIDVKKVASSDQFKLLKKDLFVAISQLDECPIFVEILSEVINER